MLQMYMWEIRLSVKQSISLLLLLLVEHMMEGMKVACNLPSYTYHTL